MHYSDLIDRYLAGSDVLRRSVAGMPGDLLDSRPIPGKWSTRQVVCHVADFEPIYADRMKRVIAEQCPTFFGGDPDTFAAGLAYSERDVGTELDLVAVIRQQMAVILRELTANDFQRIGNHAEAGSLTLEALLNGITNHVPHHVHFIEQKRKALGV